MNSNMRNVLVGAIVALVLVGMSVFVVDQRQTAIVFQLSEVIRVESTPGLKFKLPLIQNVRYFDNRLQTLDTPDPEKVLTAEKKNMLVDSFVKWRIVDVKQYYITTKGGDEEQAKNRLMQTVNAAMQDEFGKRTIHDVVSGKRDELMQAIREKTDEDARTFGVEVVDVRLKRVDFPVEISDSVYRRMESERKRVANELRATGNAESEKIRADADRQRQVTLAQAYRDAQKIKGEGDARASALYAGAFGRNSEFYAFYRSLDAYKQTFKNKSDVMVLDPSSAFFKYLKSSSRGGK